MKLIKPDKYNPNTVVVVLLAVWTVLNIVQAVFTGLANDELYYWYISKQLDWGYFDHPPLFALLTWLGVSFGGDASVWIRIGTVLIQPIYLYVFWTLVRTPRSTASSALRFVLVAFAIPLMQLYGFIVTPDAPLLLFTALTLWSYKKYTAALDGAEGGKMVVATISGDGTLSAMDQNDESLSAWLATGWRPLVVATLCLALSFAGLAYAKYHGALVVLFLICSNLSLLRRGSFWAACGVALLLVVPHLMWQAEHDWVSLRYHLTGRNSIFEWGQVGEYLLNLLVIFNPLLFLFFVGYIWRSGKSRDPLERAMRFITWGFILFFGVSTFKGQVQPQWLIPLVFPVIYFICRWAEGRRAASRYFLRVGWITALVFVAVRVFVMSYTGDKINLDIFVNERDTKQLYQDLEGRPFLPDSYYATAARYIYYTGGDSYALPSIYLRSSQFEYIDGDTPLYGRPVAIVISTKVLDSLTKEQMDARFLCSKTSPIAYEIYYDTVDFYIPTRKVEITVSPTLPPKMLTGQRVPLTLVVHNPYDFDIPLGGDQFHFLAQFRYQRLTFYEADLKINPAIKLLPAGQTIRIKTQMYVPEGIESRKYMLGFTLQRHPFSSWYNSPRVEVQVVNPNNKM